MTGTRERIMEAALDLFSERGYDSVSIQQIADKVGIKGPSIYKHFLSKQEIFDEILSFVKKQYETNSIFSFANHDKRLKEYELISKSSPTVIADKLCSQLRVISFHPLVGRTRKLLVIEQYRKDICAKEIERRQYVDVFDYVKGLVEFLMKNDQIIQGDAELITLQFMSPISVQIERVDRNPAVLPEAERIIKKHICSIFEMYGKRG